MTQNQLTLTLAKVVLGNRIALDYLLAKQGGTCVEVNITCCTWTSNSGDDEDH